jgi:hypothetical protein
LAVNHSPNGAAPQLLFPTPPASSSPSTDEIRTQGFSRQLVNGSVAVVLLNRGSTATQLAVDWAQLQLPVGATCTVRDLMARRDVSTFAKGYQASVDGHSVAMLKVTC